MPSKTSSDPSRKKQPPSPWLHEGGFLYQRKSCINPNILAKLAQAAGRTPRSVLKYVLRDGFEMTEHAVRAVTARMQSSQRVAHEDAMRQLDQMIRLRHLA